ncbi:MAG TPA: hypothetical protein VGB10_01820 [Bacteroidota bacterium]
MRTQYKITLLTILLLIVTAVAVSDVKEARGVVLRKVDKQGGNGFQIRVSVVIPSLPEQARIDRVVLILDQPFEMPTEPDLNAEGEPMEMKPEPKGMRNKTAWPLHLNVYGFEVERASQSAEWLQENNSKQSLVGSGALLPSGQLQYLREQGRWKDEAAKFDVTKFVAEASKNDGKTLEFVIASDGEKSRRVNFSKLGFDLSKLTARLRVYYTEPLQELPPGYEQ